MEDPNPLVAGGGIAQLRAGGTDVIVCGVYSQAAVASRELNIGFFSRMQRQRPWLRLKVAASLDGRTALQNGTSQWITGEAARTDGHAWRRRAGAVLTGVGTVAADNPRLDVRLVSTPHQPLRVLVDSRLDAALSARIFDAPGNALVYCANPTAERLAALVARGVDVQPLPGGVGPNAGKVDLAAMLADLAGRGINELHVEAGQQLNGSLVRERLVDEFLIYLAPKLLGAGRDMAAFGPLTELTDALSLRFHQIERIGDDLRVLARPAAK